MSGASAAIIVIGAEVLSAKVVDENGPFLLAALRARGIEVRELRIIGDDVEGIGATTRELAARHTYVLTTGGVGPTHDDVTMAGIAHAFATEVHRDPELVRRIEGYSGGAALSASLKMAEVPRGAVVTFPVEHGFVPVVRMQNVYVLPGVPSLVRSCYRALEPELASGSFYTGALYFKADESIIADALTLTQSEFPDVAIGSYPTFEEPAYQVKVTFDGRSQARVDEATAALRQRIDARLFVTL